MDGQGERKYLWNYFITISWMLDLIDAFKEEFKEEAFKDTTFSDLSECCAHSWNKIEKYHNLCD